MDPENIALANAIEATSDLYLRQLAQHVRIGPMPLGTHQAILIIAKYPL